MEVLHALVELMNLLLTSGRSQNAITTEIVRMMQDQDVIRLLTKNLELIDFDNPDAPELINAILRPIEVLSKSVPPPPPPSTDASATTASVAPPRPRNTSERTDDMIVDAPGTSLDEIVDQMGMESDEESEGEDDLEGELDEVGEGEEGEEGEGEGEPIEGEEESESESEEEDEDNNEMDADTQEPVEEEENEEEEEENPEDEEEEEEAEDEEEHPGFSVPDRDGAVFLDNSTLPQLGGNWGLLDSSTGVRPSMFMFSMNGSQTRRELDEELRRVFGRNFPRQR